MMLKFTEAQLMTSTSIKFNPVWMIKLLELTFGKCYLILRNVNTHILVQEQFQQLIQWIVDRNRKSTYEKDLGVSVDQALNFSKHISTQVSKANRILGIIFRTFTYMDTDMFLNLYKSIVRPHLEYAVTVCTPLYENENVQRRATKLVSSIKHLSYKD